MGLCFELLSYFSVCRHVSNHEGRGAQKLEKANDVCARRDPEDSFHETSKFSTQVEEGAVGQIKKCAYSSVGFKRI